MNDKQFKLIKANLPEHVMEQVYEMMVNGEHPSDVAKFLISAIDPELVREIMGDVKDASENSLAFGKLPMDEQEDLLDLLKRMAQKTIGKGVSIQGAKFLETESFKFLSKITDSSTGEYATKCVLDLLAIKEKVDAIDGFLE